MLCSLDVYIAMCISFKPFADTSDAIALAVVVGVSSSAASRRDLMATVSGIAGEISEVAELLGIRSQQINVSGLRTNLCDSLAQRILQLKSFNANDALLLTRAMGENEARLTEYGIKVIGDAIDGRLRGSAQASVARADRNDTQYLTNPCVWFTKAEMLGLRDPRKSLDVKITIVVHRLRDMLGVTNPHEQTYRALMALLALVGFEVFPKYRCLFNVLGDLKDCFNAVRGTYPHGHLVKYPNAPSDLPVAMYNFAYDESDPPVAVELDRYEVVCRFHIPLRKNSKLLTDEARKEGAPMHPDAPITWSQLKMLQNGGACTAPDQGNDCNITVYGRNDRRRGRSLPMLGPGFGAGRSNVSDDALTDPSVETPPSRGRRDSPMGDHQQQTLSKPSLFGSLVPRSRVFGNQREAQPGPPSGHVPDLAKRLSSVVERPVSAAAADENGDDDDDDEDGGDAVADERGEQPAHVPAPQHRPSAADYEAAAVRALSNRDARRAEEKAEAKAAKAAAAAAGKPPASKGRGSCKGRGRGKGTSVEGRGSGKGRGRGKGACLGKGKAGSGVVGAIKVEAPKKRKVAADNADDVPPLKLPKGAPLMPKLSGGKAPDAVDYNGGRIYTSLTKTCFRVIRERGNYYSEKMIGWKAPKPSKDHWIAAVHAIDTYTSDK